MVAAGVLISGAGTNLRAILACIAAGELDCTVRIVVSNRPTAAGLTHAEAAGVPTRVLEHGRFATRDDFDRAVIDVLCEAGVELVVLAGFDRLISPRFVAAFPSRIMNIHPGLLPAFKGLHAQRDALEYGVKLAGATVHFVDEETDHGPIIVQGAVPVSSDDTEETLRGRILAVEHAIYPAAIQLYAEGRLAIEGRRVRVLGRPPPLPPALVHC